MEIGKSDGRRNNRTHEKKNTCVVRRNRGQNRGIFV